MAKLDTYIVIEVNENGNSVDSFTHDTEGLVEAKTLFLERVRMMVEDDELTEERIQSILQAEIFEIGYGEYIQLTTTTKIF